MDASANEERKAAIIKILAIIGFIVVLIFVAWLAVQAVRLAPATFNKLTSIADELKDDTKPEFTISSSVDTVHTGETLSISWTEPNKHGTYSFSYQCADGVAVEIKDDDGNRSFAACNADAPIATNGNTVEIIFSSEKSQYVDVPYTVKFTADGETLAYAQSGTITVINQAIGKDDVTMNTPPVVAGSDGDREALLEEIPNTGITEEPKPTTDLTPELIRYRTVPVVTTTIPVSNPNGNTDLAVTFIGVGSYDTSTGRFTTKTALEKGTRAALQFEVKNIGAKTSTEWYFTASVPTDPKFTYASTANRGLAPNERQIITLQFDDVSKDDQSRVTASVTGGGDAILSNNSFSKTIDIRD